MVNKYNFFEYKEAFLANRTRQNDYKFLIALFKWSSRIGVAPYKSKENKFYCRFFALFFVLLFILYAVFCVITIMFNPIFHFLSSVDRAGYVVYFVCQTIFVVSFVSNFFFKIDHWKTLFATLRELENMIDKPLKERKIKFFFVESFITISGNASVQFLGYPLYHSIYAMCFSQWLITAVYFGFLVSIVRNFSGLLHGRYKLLVRILLEQKTKRAALEDIRKVTGMLKMLFLVMKAFNQIFGWAIFFAVIFEILAGIQSVTFCLQYTQTIRSPQEFTLTVIYLGSVLVARTVSTI